MASLNFNGDQLGVGNAIVSDITKYIGTFSSKLNSNITSVKSAAKAYKVNLDNTIVMDNIESDFENMKNSLDECAKLAKNAYNLVMEYNSGGLHNKALQSGKTDFDYFQIMAQNLVNEVNPNVATKVVATIGLSAFKFGEGFTEFFEDIGDFALSAGSFVMSALGDDKAAKTLADKASEQWSVDMWENNSAFEWFNKNSYYDKDSTAANLFKIGGKVTAGIVTGKVASNLYLSNGATSGAEAATKAGEISKNVTKFTNFLGSNGSNVASNLRAGKSFEEATNRGLGTAMASFVLTETVANPAGAASRDLISKTPIGEVVDTLDDHVTNFVGQEGKEFMKKGIDIGTKELKKETTGNLVHGDGNEKSEADIGAEIASNTVIDTGKEVIKNLF